jgi:hypothetical protein
MTTAAFNKKRMTCTIKLELKLWGRKYCNVTSGTQLSMVLTLDTSENKLEGFYGWMEGKMKE